MGDLWSLLFNLVRSVLMLVSLLVAIGLEAYALKLVLREGEPQWDKATFMLAAAIILHIAYNQYINHERART